MRQSAKEYLMRKLLVTFKSSIYCSSLLLSTFSVLLWILLLFWLSLNSFVYNLLGCHLGLGALGCHQIEKEVVWVTEQFDMLKNTPIWTLAESAMRRLTTLMAQDQKTCPVLWLEFVKQPSMCADVHVRPPARFLLTVVQSFSMDMGLPSLSMTLCTVHRFTFLSD